MKFFAIGVGRTGTASLCVAMRILGFKAKHNISSLQYVQDYEFTGDHLVAGNYKFLDLFYAKNAKFLVTVRDVDECLNSYERFFTKKNRHRPRRQFALCRARFALFEQFDYNRKQWKQAIEQHYAGIQKHFKGREKDVLYLNIIEGEGWEKLCPFVGKEIPSVPFPREHDTNEELNGSKRASERSLQPREDPDSLHGPSRKLHRMRLGARRHPPAD